MMHTYIRQSDGKQFLTVPHQTPLYHPEIVAADGERDYVKFYGRDNDGNDLCVSLQAGHNYTRTTR